MSAPLLGVDKALKNNVPPLRATSGMPIIRWTTIKGCVLILSSIITGCGSHLKKKMLLMSNTKKCSGPYIFFYMEHGDEAL